MSAPDLTQEPVLRTDATDATDAIRAAVHAEFDEVLPKAYDALRHDAIDGRAADGEAIVTKVHTRGLTSYGDVIVRARVEISPERPPL